MYSRTCVERLALMTVNTVCQGRWSLVTGSLALWWGTFHQEYVVIQDRWSLMTVVSQDRFHCMRNATDTFVVTCCDWSRVWVLDRSTTGWSSCNHGFISYTYIRKPPPPSPSTTTSTPIKPRTNLRSHSMVAVTDL